MATAAPRIDWTKYAFFLLLALATLGVIWVDERFWIDPTDPNWVHIAPFRSLLMLRGLLGVTAFVIGPFQFSDRLRRTRPQVHRWMGRIYVGAIFVSAPIATWIGSHLEGPLTRPEQIAQGGGWFLCTAIALACVLRRNFALHKAWMMRSYAFCTIFIVSRVPDLVPGFRWNDALLSTSLWWLIAGALVLPDVVLTFRALTRRRLGAA